MKDIYNNFATFSFISMRDRQWIFGSFYCRLNSFTSCFTVSETNWQPFKYLSTNLKLSQLGLS